LKYFILQNNIIEKENEIINLEKFLKKINNLKEQTLIEGEIFIKNTKDNINTDLLNTDDNFRNSAKKEEVLIIKQVLSLELDYCRRQYQQVTKQTLNKKNTIKDYQQRIEKIKNEIELYKNPQRLELIELKDNTSVALNTGITTMPSTKMEKEVLKTNENITNNEELLKTILNQVNTNNNYTEDLKSQIDLQKKANLKLDDEISSLNNEFSEKFSLILDLESQLETFITRKKKIEKQN